MNPIIDGIEAKKLIGNILQVTVTKKYFVSYASEVGRSYIGVVCPPTLWTISEYCSIALHFPYSVIIAFIDRHCFKGALLVFPEVSWSSSLEIAVH